MLNVTLLRKVQESILDTKQPFSMATWNTCICAHVKHVVTGCNLPLPINDDLWTSTEGAASLGLNPIDANMVFLMSPLSRYTAVEALEQFVVDEERRIAATIAQEPQPEPEGELVLA